MPADFRTPFRSIHGAAQQGSLSLDGRKLDAEGAELRIVAGRDPSFPNFILCCFLEVSAPLSIQGGASLPH